MKHNTTISSDAGSLRSLVELSGHGDAEAFGRLYDELYDRIYGYAYRRVFDRAAAEDVTATVFYNVMTGLGRFKWQHDGGFYGWVFRITAHEVVRYYRQRSRYIVPEDWLSFSDTIRDERLRQDELSEQTERVRILYSAVEKLPTKLRSVIELYYFAGLPHATIAEALAISEGATRVRLHRGLGRLQEIMKGEGYEY